jgi:hypothetical protein
MPQPSLDALRTPANCQIFALKKPLSRAAVQAAFDSASEKASGRKLGKTIRERRAVNGKDFWASFICFPLTRCPPFLPGTDLEENSYGFLLLVELQVKAEWFVGIFKHGASSLSEWLEVRAKPLPRGKFTNAFSGDSTFKKMSLQRMGGSKYELQFTTYEAPDLRTAMPMIAASRSVVRAVRFEDKTKGNVAVTASTSRVQQSGGRCPAGELADLVRIAVEGTLADKRDAFLATFAQAVAIDDLPLGTQPTSVLFHWNAIMETDSLELHRKPPRGEELGAQLPKKLLYRVLGETLPAVPDGPEWQFGRLADRPRGVFGLTSTNYSVKAILGNRMVVLDVTEDETISIADGRERQHPLNLSTV